MFDRMIKEKGESAVQDVEKPAVCSTRWGGGDDTRPKKHVQVHEINPVRKICLFMISGYMLEYVGSYEIPALQLGTGQERSPIEIVRDRGKGKGSTKEGRRRGRRK
jgi:hypothetical protein